MYCLQDLLYLMRRLRDPQTGCPWDIKQDFASILPHTLEEAYEVADAIERQDWPHLEEELGDLLFQVVFYGQIADERQLFNVESIVHRLVEKLIRRHPHVFPDGLHSQRDGTQPLDEQRIQQQWQDIKQREKDHTSTQPDVGLLSDVPVTMPAMTRAIKLQKKAASVGFDWPDVRGVLDKIREELDEVEVELARGDIDALTAEIGDLLFAVGNLARHCQVDAETALRRTNEKFVKRFAWVEQRALASGGFEQATLEQMEQAWSEAKQHER